jgi:hypothetical protein
MAIVEHLQVSIGTEQALGYLHVAQGSRLSDIVPGLIADAQRVVGPKVVYVEGLVGNSTPTTVAVNQTAFTSRVLSKNLATAGQVFPYVLTLGPGLEEMISSATDLLAQYSLDIIGNLFLYAASEVFERQLRHKYGCRQLSKMNPGSLPDWPISQQRELFSVLGNVEQLVGVRLTSSHLMIPRKSTSGILFPSQSDFVSCRLCTRSVCVNRKAAYDSTLVDEYGLSPDSDSVRGCSSDET